MRRFEVYQGVSGRCVLSGLGADVVMRLYDGTPQKNQQVFFHHFFCTTALIRALKQQDINGTGTCTSNRLQGAQRKLKSEKKLKEEGEQVTLIWRASLVQMRHQQ